MTLAYILIVALAGFCLYLLSRLGELEERIESAFAELKQLRRAEPVAPAPPVAMIPVPITVVQREPERPQERPSAVPPPLPLHQPEPSIPPAPRPIVEEPVFVRPPSLPEQPSLAQRLRTIFGDDEWETIVGGSLLNKAGALILVIGIALFLGFSFGRISPAGRAGISLAISAGILGGGIWLERRQRYQVFARGLIGAGWAALYATAYAVYAVPAARLIDNPFWGSVGVLLVAGGMIGHSLRYRAQAVTGVAYFAAFAALAATPSSPFAVIALIPLAASLLYLAARFNWYSMALFGLATTYLTCISRGSSGAPLVQTQSLFLVYWLLFEGFDLLRTKRGVATGGVEWIYPGNLAGFVGLSYLGWSGKDPEHLWMAAAGGSALFLANAIARAFLRAPDEDLVEGLRFGGYQSSAFVSAVLGGLAIVGRVQGVWMSSSLAVEAEVLYLAGVRLNSSFLRRMGISAFAHSLARVFWEEPIAKSDLWGHEIWNQSPPAMLHAVFFWLNRYLRNPNPVMSWAAAILGAGLIAGEVPQAWIGLGWVMLGSILFEIGLRRNAVDFRGQGYVLLAASSVIAFWPVTAPLAIGITLAAVYGAAVRSRWIRISERDEMAWGASTVSVLLAGLLLWRVVPFGYVGLAWAGLALLVLELGIREWPAELRILFVPAGLLASIGVGLTHADDFAKFPAPAVWISFFGTAIIAWSSAWRNKESEELRDGGVAMGVMAALAGIWLVAPEPFVTLLWTLLGLAVLEAGVTWNVKSIRWIGLLPLAAVYGRTFLYDLDNAPLRATPFAIAAFYWAWHRFRDDWTGTALFWLAPIPLMTLIFNEAGSRKAPIGWMAVALVLLFAGTRLRVKTAEIQSYIVAGMGFGLTLWSSPWQVSLACAACLYAAQFLANSSEESRAQIGFSIAGTLLVAAVLYDQISGGLLTVALGLEGLVLLGAGFALRERICRLQGLALLLFCILKLFLYDLRNLETMYRILSFIALGLILLGVSWIYTRFREHIRKLL